jgi:hypothetical protein
MLQPQSWKYKSYYFSLSNFGFVDQNNMMVLHYFHLVPHLQCDVQTPGHKMSIPVLPILACCLFGSLSNSFQHNLHCYFLDQHPKPTLSYHASLDSNGQSPISLYVQLGPFDIHFPLKPITNVLVDNNHPD